MVDIKNISKVGFGTHHFDPADTEDVESILYAINNGVNLIDTSSNYGSSAVEKGLGEILNSFDRDKLFITTKAGLISGDNLTLSNKLNASIRSGFIKISQNQFYSIHPDYIRHQIEISLQRLKSDYIDGFFLHNPEYLFTYVPNLSSDDYYHQINQAFSVLEDMTKEGKVRYYGLSESSGLTSIKQITQLSNESSSGNNFRLIQFPYNILEDYPSKPDPISNNPLSHEMYGKNLIRFSNRPLTIRENNNTYLLANAAASVNEEQILESLDQVFTLAEEHLPKDKELTDYKDFVFLYVNYAKLDDDKFFQKFYDSYFIQTLRNIVPAKIVEDHRIQLSKLKSLIISFIKHKRHEKTVQFLREKGFEHILENPTLTQYLIGQYLANKNIDHVLLGMRRKKYVDDILPILLN